MVQSQEHYDIPKTQTAVVYDACGAPLQIRKDWPVLQPSELKPGQVLVRMAYSGVCHSDILLWDGTANLPGRKLPIAGGHEGTGYVAAIGEYTQTSLQIGDPVGIKFMASCCLGCEDCRKGNESTCENIIHHGSAIDGTFQQWCVSYADHVTPLPEGCDLASITPVLCAGWTVYASLKSFGGVCGEFVSVPGAGGGLGHLACQYALAMGFRVIAIDTGDEKRKLIESYGIKDFVDFKSDNVVEKVKELSGGRGVHAACVVSNSSRSYTEALQYLRPNGAMLLVGVPSDGSPTPIHVGIAANFMYRIFGRNTGNRQDAVEAVDLAAEGKVKSNYTIDDLQNLPQVFKDMGSGEHVGRIVLNCA
ncbi:alcohol dehydrogenase [Phytophthora boehmeriae]|uniref:alcohol dehydrogenase n=1 Tax=Phytophthora boehmeriae TaxID=109152 RepID=A0A8T1VFL1_9STRA|nr:alcohol dehydrogenase [Phytophthora boehmeriae]